MLILDDECCCRDRIDKAEFWAWTERITGCFEYLLL
jgi:hypothetical protein